MSRRMWKAVEASTRKVGMGKTKREEVEEKKEKTEERENNRSKKSSRGVGDMG